jgi:ESCRT-I complex subunit VPS28
MQQQGQGNSLSRPFQILSEIKLANNRNERFLNDNLSDLFAILVATEHLETAYVRDCISNEEYNAACTKLIAQYRTAKEAIRDAVPSVAAFMEQFNLRAPAAFNRLEKIGVPATIEHGDHKQDKKQEVAVAATVHHFITTMDLLKLEMYAVDEVQPHLSDLMENLNNVSTLKPDDVAKERVKHWLILLNEMRASDQLQADQARQMLFDLDKAYNAFLKHLEKKI